jgi:UDP-glucuronate 4-epimerase
MTFIEDAVRSVLDLVQHYRQLEDTEHVANEVFNIGNHNPVVMHSVLDHLAGRLHRKPLIEYVAKGEEEIELTNADTSKLQRTIGFAPDTPIRKGLDAFVDWYAGYYHYSV